MRKPFEPVLFMNFDRPATWLADVNAAITQDKAEWDALKTQLAEVMGVLEKVVPYQAFLFRGGEFPHWLNGGAEPERLSMGAMKEYDEAKEWFEMACVYLDKHRADGRGEGK